MLAIWECVSGLFLISVVLTLGGSWVIHIHIYIPYWLVPMGWSMLAGSPDLEPPDFSFWREHKHVIM